MRDAIEARTKRALKQLFPANHKHVDGLSADGDVPFTQLALLEYYVRVLKLRSIVRSDLVAGDVSGQWNLRIDWFKSYRRVTKIVKTNRALVELEGEDVTTLELEDPTTQDEETEVTDVIEEGPTVEDFATEDLAVIPPTVDNIQKAKIAAVRLRMSESNVRMMVDEGVFIMPPNVTVKQFCKPDSLRDRKPAPKQRVHDAGIKTSGTDNYALIYEAHTKLNFGTEKKPDERRAIVYFGGKNLILGIIENPYWNGKIPIISEPVERIKGSFFGQSKIEPVKFLQWQCTDALNIGQDSAMYSLLPIYLIDPQRCPQWANLTAGLSAIWNCPPDAVKTLTLPQLWKEAMTMVDALKRQIWESMDVNETMMGKMPAGRKNNQLMGAMQQEQQINIIDHATRYEEVVLNPLVELLFEFDQQFRTAELMIESRGEIGVKAKIESIPIQQWGARYFFRWAGTEFMNNMQRLQQQIAWVNVLKGIPPNMLGGKKLDLSPMADMGTENMFGPELAPKILIDERNQFTIDPEMENEMLHNGFGVLVHEGDNDAFHLQSHMRAAKLTGDPAGNYKRHMFAHAAQLQEKQQKQMGGGGAKPGLPGMPGGAGPGVPGAPGAPRPGAQPGPPRPGGQNPPGAIQADAMPGMPGRG